MPFNFSFDKRLYSTLSYRELYKYTLHRKAFVEAIRTSTRHL